VRRYVKFKAKEGLNACYIRKRFSVYKSR